MKEKNKKIMKFSIFILIAISPFLTVTNILGLNVFLDSFEKPEYYQCIKNNNYLFGTQTNEQYLILQKASHPDFKVEDNDEIIYFGNNGNVLCRKVNEIYSIDTNNKFYSVNYKGSQKEIIKDNQIIGKVVKIIYDNIWDTISIKFWDASIHNLNIRSLIEKN